MSARAVNLDETAVLPDDPVDRGEAEARALVEALGREERLEKLAEGVRVHALAVVADGVHDGRAGETVRISGGDDVADRGELRIHGDRAAVRVLRQEP